MMGILLTLCSTLVASLICIHLGEASYAAKEPFVIYTSEAFFAPISRYAFGKAFAAEDEIEFIPSILGMPDLPNWMFYKYPNGSEQAYLYGAPQDDGDLEVEVIAMNKYTYDTFRDTIKFRVIAREKTAKYQVEVKFLNLDIEDMFEGDKIRDVLEIFKDRLWKESDSVYVTNIAAPSDVGGRFPLDPKDKEGAIIRIGSTDDFSRDLLDLEREVERIKNRNPCPRKYKATSAEYLFRSKDFHSDWCSFQLIRPSEEAVDEGQRPEPGQGRTGSDDKEASQVTHLSTLFNDADYSLGRKGFPRRDYVLDLLYCAVIPLIVGVMVVSSLSCIFYYREQLDKLRQETPTEQLQQYMSIQRASCQLRDLGHSRDRALLPSSPNSTLQRVSLPLLPFPPAKGIVKLSSHPS